MRHSRWILKDCGLDYDALLKNESVFSSANGYLGVRGNFEEGYGGLYDSIRGAYINGFYDINSIGYDEKLFGFPENKQSIVNIHDVQTVRLFTGGEEFNVSSGNIISFSRELDMSSGVCKRDIEWESPGGRRVKIHITRMASLAVKELFVIDYNVTPVNFDGEISFISECSADVVNYSDGSDPRTKSCDGANLEFVGGDIDEGLIYLESRAAHSRQALGTSVSHTLSQKAEFAYSISGMTARAAVKINAKRSESVRLVKYAHCLFAQDNEGLSEKALALSSQNTGRIDELYKKQREFLDERWAMADISIDSDDGAQTAMRYCVYQLICQSALCEGSIPAKGLSGEGYEGHYFWDTEIFIQPFFALTHPETARKLLLYRYKTLDAARENARILGHKCGAAYPWRTISGSECSTFFPAGAAQYHINADIAYAVISYCCATGDEELLLREGAEIIFETARLWLELGHFSEGIFRIDGVTGPDEYTCMVNNNYYTNILAQHNLKWAVLIYNKLKETEKQDVAERIALRQDEADEFEKAYKNMYLPYDETAGITPQDDSFLSKKVWDFENTLIGNYPLLLHYHPMLLYRHQVCKQADVLLAYYLFQNRHDKELMKASYAYYEGITTHDSSLSSCVFSIMAARLGWAHKAYDYFRKTMRLDIDDIHCNTKDGLHMANMGGAYLCVTGGFAGLSIDEDGACLSPVLPEQWRSCSFKFMYRGSVFEVAVNKQGTKIIRLSGGAHSITVNGKTDIY